MYICTYIHAMGHDSKAVQNIKTLFDDIVLIWEMNVEMYQNHRSRRYRKMIQVYNESMIYKSVKVYETQLRPRSTSSRIHQFFSILSPSFHLLGLRRYPQTYPSRQAADVRSATWAAAALAVLHNPITMSLSQCINVSQCTLSVSLP